ncbi:MAG: hypothetical protein U9Q78_00435 [Chloroflexota bacterium]|nr:hypothetical protein [Chloroflexota bacterium]
MSRTWNYVVSYLLWAVSATLGIFDMLKSLEFLSSIFGLLSPNRWVHSALDKFGILTLGLIGLTFVIFCEHYYREGVKEKMLWRRFGLVTAVEFCTLLVAGFVPSLIS